ncbi:MAG TPA: response regulator transcription factor [Saprospiraceae bacterium]|nr:response regulator transcription factor [Saprospiraceae bacterium]
MINLCITDDHQMVLEGLQLLLQDQREIHVVKICRSAKDLLEYLSREAPDVILLDINMPEMNGIEACKTIKKEHPAIKVIALSMITEANLIKLMLKNGAEGYLHKNAGREEIVDAVVDVYHGKKYLSSEVSELLMQISDKDPIKSTESPFPKLSRRESEILQLIVDEKTTHEIAGSLFIGFGTVETHRRNIMIKLGSKNTAGLVRTAIEYGLVR